MLIKLLHLHKISYDSNRFKLKFSFLEENQRKIKLMIFQYFNFSHLFQASIQFSINGRKLILGALEKNFWSLGLSEHIAGRSRMVML